MSGSRKTNKALANNTDAMLEGMVSTMNTKSDFMNADGTSKNIEETHGLKESTSPQQENKSTYIEADEKVYLVPLDKLEEADSKLNVFPKWSDEEMLVNKASIFNNGLYSPIIVMEHPKEKDKYIILAGHNRVRAYKELKIEAESLPAKDSKRANLIERFSTINAYVKPSTLDNDTQLAIVVETNLRARQKLGKKAEVEAMNASYTLLQKQKDISGKPISEALKEMDIKKSTVYEAVKLLNGLHSELRELYYRDLIQKRNAMKLAMLSSECQVYLATNHLDSITDAICKNINSDLSCEDLASLFHPRETVKMYSKACRLTVNSEYKDLLNEWYEEHFEKTWMQAFEKYKMKKIENSPSDGQNE